MKYAFFVVFLFIGYSSFAQFKNTKLTEAKVGDKFQPCEPSVAINLKNTNNIVAAVVLDRIIYTNDAGNTWQEKTVTSPFGV